MVVHIWLYGTGCQVLSHDEVLKSTEASVSTYDTSFFSFDYLKECWPEDKGPGLFDDVFIHWECKGKRLTTSLTECLHNECKLLKTLVRPVNNMQKVFWNFLYKGVDEDDE